MGNPFRLLVKAWHKDSVLLIAKKTKLSRNTIDKIINNLDEIPPQVKLETLYRLADYFGYRVRVTLERKENES